MTQHPGTPRDVPSIIGRVYKPKKALVTAGMPYANGPLHLGHLAGAHIPADIHARWLGLLIGRENVLFVCGTDEHGSASEIGALNAKKPLREYIDDIHDRQASTLQRYGISLDTYTGTSRPETFPLHAELCRDFLRKLHENGLLEKRSSRQWFDPQIGRFLPDRFVRGKCPNPQCGYEDAYSDECERCGHQHRPVDLIAPRSAVSSATPELRDTVHWWLDMWDVSEILREWLAGKKDTWRSSVWRDVYDRVLPSLGLERAKESTYEALKAALPAHKKKYAQGGALTLQFASLAEMNAASAELLKHGAETQPVDEWAHRSITRDVAWGIPVPEELDPEMAGKTLYVWPDSLIAPVSFSRVVLEQRGAGEGVHAEFWRDPDSRVYQFLGQDNVFFYVLMQGALWLGTQSDPHRLPLPGELQLTDVFGCFHLLVQGEKMSKSRGNFYSGDQLLDEKGYTPDQLRYYLSLLGLPDKPSNFDFDALDERNRFLAGPMNAAFEKPISAVHSKFGGAVPSGTLLEKIESQTVRIVQQYVRAMERAEYPALLANLENYARLVNSLFTQYKPHDDRHPEEGRRDALYSSFFILKNLMIMLYPFAPETMDRLRESLRLPSTVFRLTELGTPIPAGHVIGEKGEYFPSAGARTA